MTQEKRSNRISERHKRCRLRCLILFGFAACFLTAPGSLRAKNTMPEVVARVNGAPVHRSELRKMLADPLSRRSLEEKVDLGSGDAKSVERLAVEKLIHRRLLLEEAERRDFTVSEQELDQALAVLRSRFQNVRSFGEWMEERGLGDGSLLPTLRVQVLMTKVWAALAEDVRVPEEQVEAYYEAHKDDLIIGQEVRLRIIVVRSKAEADEILSALRKGESFSRLARLRSLGKLAKRGGDTGWVNFRTIPPLFQHHVETMKAGDVLGPIEKADDEFSIVGLQGRRPLRPNSLTEARSEIERRLLPEKRQEAVDAWLSEQEKKSNIEVFLCPDQVGQGDGTGDKGEEFHAEKE